jgi:alkanesulfonate monooxygenase SsuD/methylene tetrahydromethanopterin reductase-like flavin-dependent oxidoreductase (luciferase family)
MYRGWQMQEPTMVPLQLGFDASLDDWTINGSPAECRETIARAHAMGLDGIGLTIYSLPREAPARIDYLGMIAEQIVRPAAKLGR